MSKFTRRELEEIKESGNYKPKFKEGCGRRFNEVIYEDGGDDYDICRKLNLCKECKEVN